VLKKKKYATKDYKCMHVTWHSLSKQGHIGHACGPWDGKECHEGRFSFRPMKSVFSISGILKSSFL
jgi:hypothetical protein